MERLQKVIAASGVCSRRTAEEWITAGYVQVNGKTVRELGVKVTPDDIILVQKKPLPTPKNVVYLLNKPRGVVCSNTRQGKATIITDLLPPYPKVTSVGRLDKESEGLILLTNDGELHNKLSHPKYNHSKEYWVTCRAEKGRVIVTDQVVKHFEKGVKLGDGKAVADRCTLRKEGEQYVLSIVLHEGRNHIVRRMCATQGLEVRRLKRVRIGTMELGTLKPGAYRELNETEIRRLYEPA